MRATGYEFSRDLNRDIELARYRYEQSPGKQTRRRYLSVKLEVDRRNRDKEPGTPVEVCEPHRVYFGTVVGRNGREFRVRPDDQPSVVDEVYPEFVRDRH